MPAKKAVAKTDPKGAEATHAERFKDRFKVSGRTFIWTNEAGVELHIPLRVPERVRESFADLPLTHATLRDMFAEMGMAQDQVDALLDMDKPYDLDPMYLTWQEVYLDGASLGESAASLS